MQVLPHSEGRSRILLNRSLGGELSEPGAGNVSGGLVDNKWFLDAAAAIPYRGTT